MHQHIQNGLDSKSRLNINNNKRWFQKNYLRIQFFHDKFFERLTRKNVFDAKEFTLYFQINPTLLPQRTFKTLEYLTHLARKYHVRRLRRSVRMTMVIRLKCGLYNERV